jgi:hypothetical protein
LGPFPFRETFLSTLSCLKHPGYDGSVGADKNCRACGRIRKAYLDVNPVGTATPVRAPKVKIGEDFDRDVEVENLRSDLARVGKAYKMTVKDKAKEQRLVEMFERSIATFPSLPKSAFAGKGQRSADRHRSNSKHFEVPVLLQSDQQIGEEISAGETYGINSYNFDVYQSRLEHLEDRVLDILGNHQNGDFRELVVLSLGDNVSGVIHPELQKYGHQHIIDQVYLGALTEALFLYRLKQLGGFERIRFVGVSGNHGRLSHEKESKRYFANFDYLFNSIVATALRNVEGIDVHVPRSLFTVAEVAKHRILVSHGHEMPPSSLGIPLYSINRASAAYQEMFAMSGNPSFDYWVMGHFHRPMTLDGSIVNGTMAGLSEYGIGKFKPIKPMQRLLGFHSKWGLAWEYPIRLDKAPADRKIYTFDSQATTAGALEMFQERVA